MVPLFKYANEKDLLSQAGFAQGAFLPIISFKRSGLFLQQGLIEPEIHLVCPHHSVSTKGRDFTLNGSTVKQLTQVAVEEEL
jgi:hypothetical protein